MSTRTFFSLLALAGVVFLYNLVPGKPNYRLPPGMYAPTDPIQRKMPGPLEWQQDGYTFRALAEFQLTARVLSASRYRLDGASKLAPVDLALGWGQMSDTRLLSTLKISQGGRFYYWSAEKLTIPVETIISHSANMHLVPATSAVRRAILDYTTDDIVYLKGYLVRIDRSDGWHWVSSLQRTDSGAGACELIWVTDTFSINPVTIVPS